MDTTTSGNATFRITLTVGGSANVRKGDAVTSSPHAEHAANRAADLALLAASDPTCRHATCRIAVAARTLLTQQVGPEAADRLITEARAVWRDHTNPAENLMTADDDALYRAEQGA